MKKITLSLFLGVLLQTSLLLAASGSFALVTDVGTSARMIRIANIEGFSRFANTALENPASLYQTNRGSASVFSTKIANETNYQNYAFSFRTKYGVIGMANMSASVEGIPHTALNLTSNEFVAQESFNHINSMTKFSYQYSQSRTIHFGVSSVLYNSSFGTFITGSGFNVDAGLIIDSDPLTLSIFARNLMPNEVSYSGEYTSSTEVDINNDPTGNNTTVPYNGSETLELQTVYGLRYKLTNFTIYGQLKTLGSSFAKSFAVTYRPTFLPLIELSAGYKEFAVLQNIQNNITIGVGLNLWDISFDYAFEKSDHVAYDSKHYFSFAISL